MLLRQLLLVRPRRLQRLQLQHRVFRLVQLLRLRLPRLQLKLLLQPQPQLRLRLQLQFQLQRPLLHQLRLQLLLLRHRLQPLLLLSLLLRLPSRRLLSPLRPHRSRTSSLPLLSLRLLQFLSLLHSPLLQQLSLHQSIRVQLPVHRTGVVATLLLTYHLGV